MSTPEQRPPVAGRSSAPPGDPIAALFEHARGDGFTGSETEQLWTSLGVALGLPTSTAGAGTSAGSASTAGGALGTKTLAALLLGGSAIVAAGGFVAVRAVDRTMHHAVPTAVSTTAMGVPARDVGPPSSTVATSAGEVAVARNAQATLVLPGAAAASPIERSPQARPTRPESASHPTSPGVRLQETAAPQPLASRSIEHVEEKASGEPLAGRPSIDPAPNEGALLLRARQVLAADPSTALELTREHAKLFPAGGLVPEREVLAIEALVQLGRLDEAQARFGAFRSRFPRSPHLARLGALLHR
jgi:hypothetical protein